MVSTRGTKFKFTEGERVLCYEPDPTKAKVLYESKVLELVTSKDGRGRKIPEYLIHFNGWSNSWDRCVTEEFVLRDNEENRTLQKRLAEAAALNLIHPIRRKSKKKKRRLSDLLRESFGGKNRRRTWGGPLTDEELGGIADEFRNANASASGGAARAASGSGPDDSNASQSSKESSTAENSEEEEEVSKVMELQFPDALKKKLEDGHHRVKHDGMLIQLPCSPNVITVIEGYVRNYMANALCLSPGKGRTCRSHLSAVPDKNINLCKEVMDGLRIYFDFTLPIMLLYDEERPQYAHFLEHYKPPCEPLPCKTSPSDVMPPVLVKEESGEDVIDVEPHLAPPPLSSIAAQTTCKPLPQKASKRDSMEDTIEVGFPGRILRSTASRLEAKSHANMSKQIEQVTCSASTSQSDHSTAKSSSQGKTTKCSRALPTNKQSPASAAMTTPASRTKGSNSAAMTTPASRTKGSNSPPSSPSPNAIAPPKLIPESSLSPLKKQPPPLQPHPPTSPSISNSIASSYPPSSPPAANIIQRSSRSELGDVLHQSLCWQLIPQSVYLQVPPPPSLIYGANHFLRLFVKLPEMLTRTNIADYKLNVIHNHLELFLKYMADCQEELFANAEVANTFGASKLSEKSEENA